MHPNIEGFFICWIPHCLLHLGFLTSRSCSLFLHLTILSVSLYSQVFFTECPVWLFLSFFFFNLALFFSDPFAPLTSLSLLRSFFSPIAHLLSLSSSPSACSSEGQPQTLLVPCLYPSNFASFFSQSTSLLWSLKSRKKWIITVYSYK